MFSWINIELTSMCNKHCHFCGRVGAKIEYGDMKIELFEKILDQLNGVEIIQLHRDGEPLLYDNLAHVLGLCRKKGILTNIVTNGKNLSKKIVDLRDCTTITVSVFEQDSEQFNEITQFIHATDKPKLFIKLIDNYEGSEYKVLNLPILKRQLHESEGSRRYLNVKPMIPEIGICTDLFKPAISWKGEMFMCCRFDPEKKGLLGDLSKSTIHELWYSDKRLQWLEYHKQGKRELVPLCSQCEFWGVPTVC